MRKALISIGAGPQERLLRLARTSFAPYADRHGYDLHLMTDVIDPSRPASWSKVAAFKELHDDYDVLLWLDADLVIVDGRRDIVDELADGRFLYMVEHHSKANVMPNAGVMMLRTGDHCREFLDLVWEQEDLIDHPWWENGAICRLLGYQLDPLRHERSTVWGERTQMISGRWNSIHDAPTSRPYIRHYPGYSLKVRTAFMLRDVAVAGALRTVRRG
jgi:hypothetical protein